MKKITEKWNVQFLKPLIVLKVWEDHSRTGLLNEFNPAFTGVQCDCNVPSVPSEYECPIGQA